VSSRRKGAFLQPRGDQDEGRVVPAEESIFKPADHASAERSVKKAGVFGTLIIQKRKRGHNIKTPDECPTFGALKNCKGKQRRRPDKKRIGPLRRGEDKLLQLGSAFVPWVDRKEEHFWKIRGSKARRRWGKRRVGGVIVSMN